MNRTSKLLLFVFLCIFATNATRVSAESLVSSLSDDAIEITSSFTGSRIVVFGAVSGSSLDDADDPYGVAVLVQGPRSDSVIRKKGRVAGVWLNTASYTFDDVPAYDVVHLSENFVDIASPRLLASYRLGLENLPVFQEAEGQSGGNEFVRQFLRLKGKDGLYEERHDAITFLAPDVFRTTFFLPAVVPTGTYKVSVYLFRDQTFLAGETQTLTVAKSGFSDRVASFAVNESLFYGLLSVFIGVFTGWLGGVVFRRS